MDLLARPDRFFGGTAGVRHALIFIACLGVLGPAAPARATPEDSAEVDGFGESLCASGSPVFGDEFGCGRGLQIWHGISASFTTLSYAVTRILAALMPDPYDAGADNPTLRLHRALSWVHLAGMIAMPILGIATSLTEGKTRDALGTVHLATGYATLGALSTAASLMAF